MAGKTKKSKDGRIGDMQSRVLCRSNAPDYSGFGDDEPFDLGSFKKNFKINILKHTEEDLVFEMIGINAAVANAFRRIMISEVPTVAIEKCFVKNNTSVIHDEILAHRLGLVPIRFDPSLFEIPKDYASTEKDETNTLVFQLQIACTKKPNSASIVSSAATDKFNNAEVLSSSLKWEPIGDQNARFAADPPRCVHDDILLAKLRPGQVIDIECWAHKGVGKEHAKWSPVATASYKMLAEVVLPEPILGADAETLVERCPMGVFDIEDLGSKRSAKVVASRNCTMCRECIRHPGWEDRVHVNRVQNHFVFSIESSGCMPPAEIFKKSVQVLLDKCAALDDDVTQLMGRDE